MKISISIYSSNIDDISNIDDRCTFNIVDTSWNILLTLMILGYILPIYMIPYDKFY